MAGGSGNADKLAEAMVKRWAGSGEETAEIREALLGLFGPVFAFNEAARLTQNWQPLLKAFGGGGSGDEADELAFSGAASFLLGLMPSNLRSLEDLFPKADSEPTQIGEGPAPGEVDDSGGDEEPSDEDEDDSGEASREIAEALRELSQLVDEWLDSKQAFRATGKFPGYRRALDRALRRLGKGFGPRGVTAVLDFFLDLYARYASTQIVCSLLEQTLGQTFRSNPIKGARIEEKLRDVARETLSTGAPRRYLVHQETVYYAQTSGYSLGAEATRRQTRYQDGSLQVLRDSRRSTRSVFLRRAGARVSREDLVVFCAQAPSAGVRAALSTSPFPKGAPFPEIYEVKPVGSVSDAPNQVCAYAHNYAIAHLLRWLKREVPWSPTPTLADPDDNTLGLPGLTVAGVTGLVLPGSDSDILAELKKWISEKGAMLIIPFMVQGAWGVVPYVSYRLPTELAVAALAAGVARLLKEIKKYAEKIKQALEAIEELVMTFALCFLVGTLIVGAAIGIAVAAAGAAAGAAAATPVIATAGAVLLIVIVASAAAGKSSGAAPGGDERPEDQIRSFNIGRLTIKATPRDVAQVLTRADVRLVSVEPGIFEPRVIVRYGFSALCALQVAVHPSRNQIKMPVVCEKPPHLANR